MIVGFSEGEAGFLQARPVGQAQGCGAAITHLRRFHRLPGPGQAVVGEDDVAAGDGDGLLDEGAADFEFVADAKRERQRIFVVPVDEQQVGVGQVVMAGADGGEADRVAVAGIEIGDLAGGRAEDFFEDQHVAGSQCQGRGVDQRGGRCAARQAVGRVGEVVDGDFAVSGVQDLIVQSFENFDAGQRQLVEQVSAADRVAGAGRG